MSQVLAMPVDLAQADSVTFEVQLVHGQSGVPTHMVVESSQPFYFTGSDEATFRLVQHCRPGEVESVDLAFAAIGDVVTLTLHHEGLYAHVSVETEQALCEVSSMQLRSVDEYGEHYERVVLDLGYALEMEPEVWCKESYIVTLMGGME